jgi:hypothetical protein
MADDKKDSKKEKIKWTDVISRMITRTQHGEIRWQSVTPYGTVTAEKNRTSAVFRALYKGKILRLYERTVPETQLDVGEEGNPLSVLSGSIFDRKYKTVWIPEVVLEFIDDKGETLWNFPQVSALDDLLSAVQYQAAGVNEFIGSLFEEANKDS